jgi:integrase
MAHRRGKRWVASGYDKAVGRKRYIGTFDTRKEAQTAEADWRTGSTITGRETCDEFAERWTRDYPRPRPSTNKHNAERVKRFAKDFKGIKLTDVDRPRARVWAKKHQANLSAVRAMFGDAMLDGLIPMNPFANLRLPGSRGRKDIVALTERELQKLADLALDDRMELGEFGREYRAMILFAGYVGLRPGELFALRREDIRGDFCTIARSLSSTGEIGPTKTGRSRMVVIPPPAQEALRDVPDHPSGLLFTSPRDRMWTQPSQHRYWATLRKLAARPGLAFYELRHGAATMLLERGTTPWDVAQQLGHTDGGQLVMELYGHPAEANARERVLAAWDPEVTPISAARSGVVREQAS